MLNNIGLIIPMIAKRKSVTMGKLLAAAVMLFSIMKANALPTDSIGLEKKGNKTYILHKVDVRETLYSISRRYKIAVEELRKSNPEASKGLSIGQVVLVPSVEAALSVAKPSVRTNETHTVRAKENLSSIAKKYNLSLEELKQANPKWKNGLQIGQEVVIPNGSAVEGTTAEVNPEVKSASTTNKEVEPKELIEEAPVAAEPPKATRSTDVKTKAIPITTVSAPATSSYRKVNESGYAELMNNNQDGLKYLALHKNAPVGTIIQVRNDDNSQKIFVRVIGVLATATDKTILQLSPKAYERLGGKPTKMQVSISYIP